MNATTLCLIVVIAIIAILVIIKFAKKGTDNRKEAEQFLKDIEDQAYNIIIELINNLDIAKYKSLDDYKDEAIKIIYDKCWDFVKTKLANDQANSLISAIAAKLITKENVEAIIAKIMDESNIELTLYNNYAAYNIENPNELSEEEKATEELIESFKDQDQYVEDSSEMELPPAEETEIPEEELAKLNPPTDEDTEVYNEEDPTQEIVTDYILEKTNVKGQVRYYLVSGETGKKKQVSKSYVSESGLEVRSE